MGGWPKSIPTGRSAWNKRLNPTLESWMFKLNKYHVFLYLPHGFCSSFVHFTLLHHHRKIHDRKCSSVVNFKVSIIKLSLLINYETYCDKLYDLNIIKYYLKNKVQLFVVFILP